jgi:hypothetical protein
MVKLEERAAQVSVPFARRPVITISLSLLVALLAVSPFYGYYRDELYFRLLSERPSWGFFDTPPLTPMFAKLSITLFGDNVVALRVFPALAAALTVVLGALIVRELGGGRRAQILGAAGIATSGMAMLAGHSLLTLTFDFTLWSAAILFVVRALLRDGRWWYAVGIVAGLATYNRHLILMLVVAVAVGLVVAGPRDVLSDRRLWLGALIAVVIALPNLAYQLTHDWPQLTMVEALEDKNGTKNRIMFLPMQIMLLGIPLAVISIAGIKRLWRDERLRGFVVAYPVACALTLFSGGRPDYLAGLLVLLFAAGCEPTVRWMADSAKRRRLVVVTLSISGVLNASGLLPLIPPSIVGGTPFPTMNEVSAESIGWPEFVEQVGAVVADLPPGERAETVLLAQNYGQAGIYDRYSAEYDLPEVYSGHNELYFWGPPPETARQVITVTKEPGTQAKPYFASCEEMGTIDIGVELDNQENGKTILLCRDPIKPWQQLWPSFRKNN